MQYTLDRYHSLCSAIKCTLEITADDHFVASNGADYDAIQAAYRALRIMGLNVFHAYQVLSFACFRLSTYLYVLLMCLYVLADN